MDFRKERNRPENFETNDFEPPEVGKTAYIYDHGGTVQENTTMIPNAQKKEPLFMQYIKKFGHDETKMCSKEYQDFINSDNKDQILFQNKLQGQEEEKEEEVEMTEEERMLEEQRRKNRELAAAQYSDSSDDWGHEQPVGDEAQSEEGEGSVGSVVLESS